MKKAASTTQPATTKRRLPRAASTRTISHRVAATSRVWPTEKKDGRLVSMVEVKMRRKGPMSTSRP